MSSRDTEQQTEAPPATSNKRPRIEIEKELDEILQKNDNLKDENQRLKTIINQLKLKHKAEIYEQALKYCDNKILINELNSAYGVNIIMTYSSIDIDKNKDEIIKLIMNKRYP